MSLFLTSIRASYVNYCFIYIRPLTHGDNLSKILGKKMEEFGREEEVMVAEVAERATNHAAAETRTIYSCTS